MEKNLKEEDNTVPVLENSAVSTDEGNISELLNNRYYNCYIGLPIYSVNLYLTTLILSYLSHDLIIKTADLFGYVKAIQIIHFAWLWASLGPIIS